MVDGGILDHRQFIKALVNLCKDKSSGTVFYNLESGDSARLVLNHGVITWVAYGELRGEEAIEAIRLIDNARMSFNPSLKLTIGKQVLPSTPEILRQINTREFNHDSIESDLNPTGSLAEKTEEIVGRSFDKDDVCEVVVKESMEFIGPIAKVICADYMKPLPAQIDIKSVRKLIESMVIDINDETKGRIFKNRVRDKLNIE